MMLRGNFFLENHFFVEQKSRLESMTYNLTSLSCSLALKNPCHVPQCIARPAAATAFLMALKLALSYIQTKSSSIV